MAKLKWLPSFEIGHKALDDDHKELIEILDQVDTVLASGDNERAKDLVELLIDSVRKHFVHEEAVLAEIGYPRLRGHENHHIRILERADKIRENFNSASEQADLERVYEDLVSFLVADIIEADTEFKSYLQHT
ncbi:MAG: hemerythrin domain-containing protein [Rhodospirillales bacterium]|nr:hemerythrin domain-containing protein [Rhodospirillales bacterium]